MIKLDILYSEVQKKIFFQSTAKTRIVAKGRRVGFTRGCAHFIIESMLDKNIRVLWGDNKAVFKPDSIFVEINGMGAGLFDRLRQIGLPVVEADVSRKALKPKIFNKRSEMYKTFADEVSKGLKIVDDRVLLSELSSITYEIINESIFKVSRKDEIRRDLGYSPDRADACALTFFSSVVPFYMRRNMVEFPKTYNNIGGFDLNRIY